MSPSTQILNMDALSAFQAFSTFLLSTPVSILLNTFLFGVLTILAAAALYALHSNSLRRPATLAQALVVLVLYTSTAAYFVYALLYALALTDFMGAAASQIGSAARAGAPDAARSVAAAKKWWSAANAAVLVNGVIGTSVVWWRASEAWTGRRGVRYAGAFLVTAVFALGAASASLSRPLPGESSMQIVGEGVAFRLRVAFAGLGLCTSLAATILSVLKAWNERDRLARTLAKGSRGRRIAVQLGLALESGVGFCLLWAAILGYESSYKAPSSSAWLSAALYTVGLVVPLMAVHTVLTIILVALHKAQLGPRTASLASGGSRHGLTSSGTRVSGTVTTIAFGVPVASVAESELATVAAAEKRLSGVKGLSGDVDEELREEEGKGARVL